MSIMQNQRGFTLIELLVSTVITSMILVGIMTFLTTTMVSNAVRNARSDLLREAQLTLDVLTKDTRLSSNVDETNYIEDDNSPNAASTNGRGWISSDEVLVLATAVEDTSRNIIFQDATHYITEKNNIVYYVANGNLYKRTLAAEVPNNRSDTTCPEAIASDTCPADRLLARNVNDFNIRYFNSLDEEVDPLEARSVEISLSLLKRKFNRDVTTEYTTRTVFRNE